MPLELAKCTNWLPVHIDLISIIDISRHQDRKGAALETRIHADSVPGIPNVARMSMRLPTTQPGTFDGL